MWKVQIVKNNLDFLYNNPKYEAGIFNFSLQRREKLHDRYEERSKCFGMLKAKSKRRCDWRLTQKKCYNKNEKFPKICLL